jgi:hypothetical protein
LEDIDPCFYLKIVFTDFVNTNLVITDFCQLRGLVVFSLVFA